MGGHQPKHSPWSYAPWSATGVQTQGVINEVIAPFVNFIRESILIKKNRGSRVLEDIKYKEYRGSKSALYRYLDGVRQSCGGKSFKPYETADWSPFMVLIGDELVKVFIHTYILGYSRHRVYWPSLSYNQGGLFEAMEQGIHQTGGGCPRILSDTRDYEYRPGITIHLSEICKMSRRQWD